MSVRTAFELALVFVLLLSFDAPSQAAERIDLHRTDDRIEVVIGGKPFTTYYFGPESPKPYLHPLRSPRGTIVTRGWPMVKNIPGESHDHPHHRAMFFAHGNINGIDFWGESTGTPSQQTAHGHFYASKELPTGRTVFRKLETMRGGPESGTIKALFDLVGPDGKAMGSEIQDYVFHGDANSRMMDCAFTVLANRGIPLKMGDTKEGTFAIRVVKALEEPSGKMLNSEGKVGEKQIWGKRADWVDYSGVVNGESLGIAILDNPSNIKHPTYWHARGYGLFAVNPFGEHDFYNDPKRDGSVTIRPSGSLRLRYRVIIHEGDAAQAKIADAYKKYASVQ